MDGNSNSVREILGNKIGRKNARNLINKLSNAYHRGKRGNDFQHVVSRSIKDHTSTDSNAGTLVAIYIITGA